MDSPSPHPFQGLSNRDLAASITELMGHLNAANRRWLAMIAEFDRRKGWSDSMTQSCAHWLNWQCGVDLGAAREKVRVAHALEDLPLIGAAMGRGELSYAKVRALTRAANAANEEFLLMIGLHGTASHVEKLVRQYRRVQEVEALSREARQQAGRSRHATTSMTMGRWCSRRGLPAEAGMQVLKALEAAIPICRCPAEDCVAARLTFGETRNGVSAETSTPIASSSQHPDDRSTCRCAGVDRRELPRARG